MDFSEIRTYEDWDKAVSWLENALLERDSLLRQYEIWLQSSEAHTKYRGENVHYMMIGVLQCLSDIDFIPGSDDMNYAAVISRVQKKTGLDLGVCEFLEDNINQFKKFEYSKQLSKKSMPECKAGGVYIGSFKVCMPPNRLECIFRKRPKNLVSEEF